jgi:hypothetical protein
MASDNVPKKKQRKIEKSTKKTHENQRGKENEPWFELPAPLRSQGFLTLGLHRVDSMVEVV